MNTRRSRIVHLFNRIFAADGKFWLSRACVLDCGGKRSATSLSERQINHPTRLVIPKPRHRMSGRSALPAHSKLKAVKAVAVMAQSVADEGGFPQCCYSVEHGVTFQISLAYSAMVRSLENLPDAAMFRITLRVHAGWSAYNSPSR